MILWSGIRLIRALAQRFRHERVGAQRAAPEFIMSVREIEARYTPTLTNDTRGFFATLAPLIPLSLITLLIAAIVPLNNYVAVGSPTKDLYTLVWSYDQIGFGTCCGRSGHTLEKGIRQARYRPLADCRRSVRLANRLDDAARRHAQARSSELTCSTRAITGKKSA